MGPLQEGMPESALYDRKPKFLGLGTGVTAQDDVE